MGGFGVIFAVVFLVVILPGGMIFLPVFISDRGRDGSFFIGIGVTSGLIIRG